MTSGWTKILVWVTVLVVALPSGSSAARMCAVPFEGVHVRSSPCTDGTIVKTALRGESYTSTGQSKTACGYTWVQLSEGWSDATYWQPCGGNSTEHNKVGIGLVSPGNVEQWDFAQQLGGQGGWVLLTLPGVTSTSTGPDSSWVTAVNAVNAAGLNAVLRLSPPWGSSHYRSESDDPGRTNYTTLSNAFRAVVGGFPAATADHPLYLQIDNEPDLCYEWFCATAGSPLSYTEIAKEYAFFYKAVALAIRSLGNVHIHVAPAAMSPGSARTCGCCGSQNCPGDQGGVTGLDFMKAMIAAVPDVYEYASWLATHSYPASGVGYGFNAPFSSAKPGLTYYDLELTTIGRSLQVLVTETGWATKPPGGNPPCSEDDKAAWTVDAYNSVWLPDDRVQAVMPFMLQDATWGGQYGYEWVTMNNDAVAVFSQVQHLRCGLGFPPSC